MVCTKKKDGTALSAFFCLFHSNRGNPPLFITGSANFLHLYHYIEVFRYTHIKFAGFPAFGRYKEVPTIIESRISSNYYMLRKEYANKIIRGN
jgi:hypothetical protein